MRLVSATVRSYRVHGELSVEFDPARTVIGGPNESGKSTLAEAIHRALFLKSRIVGETQQGMVSTRHAGHPEVELTLHAAGRTWRLLKRFSGASGVTRLSDDAGHVFQNDEAEARLAELLRVEAVAGGRGAGERAAQQWGHLWVWQGQAGDNPSPLAEAQQGSLIQRLQQMGGAAALQSELDATVARHFATLRESLLTLAGKPKAGSDLDLAERAAAAADEELARARQRSRILQQAATDLAQASREAESMDIVIAGLERDQERLEARGRRLQELRRLEADQAHAAERTAGRCTALQTAEQTIAAFRRDVLRLGETLEPHEALVRQLEAALETMRTRAVEAERQLREAGGKARAARLHHDLAAARAVALELRESLSRLDAKAGRIEQCRQELAALDAAHARLPAVDKPALQKVQRLESKCGAADASLKAMAAGLEVVASDLPVVAADRVVDPGTRLILTEETEVRVGAGVRLVVRPGGGTGLAEAREASRSVHEELRRLLDSLGVTSTADAVDAQARREDIASRMRAVRAELTGLGAEAFDAERSGVAQRTAAAESNVERLVALAPDLPMPETLAEAVSLSAELERRQRTAERAERESAAASEAAAAELVNAQLGVDRKREEHASHKRELEAMQAQLRLLLETHGDDAVRAEATSKALATKSADDDALRATQAAIAELQPDLHEADCQRVRRALDQAILGRSDARTRIAVARSALRSDGTEDPQADLIHAEAQAARASQQLLSVRRRAQAIDRLHGHFQDEQRALADQFTKPLAARISAYLQCLFGAGARAAVAMEAARFAGIRLLRPAVDGAEYEFGRLSGGAREQVAAAVRLAMAEVLAADHDGCLPLVFDDAFAYSDPERVRQLQRMLDLAASRGLQVVVLTCTPADYATLGARVITLPQA